jgi:hypothetical protein
LIRLVVRLALVIFGVSMLAISLTRLTDIPQGDPMHGETLFDGASRPYLGCLQCHQNLNIAPRMVGLSKRIQQERLRRPENTGETVAEYLAESIIQPERYIVPGYLADLMPPTYSVGGSFGLSWRDLNDLVAYMMTL